MSQNTIDIIGNIIVPFITVFVSAWLTLKITDKKEETKLYNEEKTRVQIAVKKFEQKIIGQYMDILNNGKAYNELKEKANNGKTEKPFIQSLQDSFKDEIQYYDNKEIVSKYNLIKDFYDNKVYGQYNSEDYIFAKDFVKLIEELCLDEKMISTRDLINKERKSS